MGRVRVRRRLQTLPAAGDLTQFSGGGHRVPGEKYGRWPLSLSPFSRTASERTYPTPPGGVVQNQELSLGGQQQTLDLKVQFNYHIELREDRHYYSVPWRLKGTRVQVLYNDRMVEIYHDHLRVAAHRRARAAGDYTTVVDHMPPQHRFYADWSPERILRWAGAIGPEVAALVGKVLDEREHPEQGFKVALGIINLHRKYGEERLQRACGRALEFRCAPIAPTWRQPRCGSCTCCWHGSNAHFAT